MNKLARSVTKWTRACDKRLARLTSYVHHTNDHRQYCHVGNTAQHCRLGLFQDADFASDLRAQNQSREESYVSLEAEHFVPISWMCRKQTSVSLSSAESDIISLDAGLRMDGLPALDIWDVVIEVRDRKPFEQQNPRQEHQLKGATEMLINGQMWTTYPQTHVLLKASLSCTSWKTTKQSSS